MPEREVNRVRSRSHCLSMQMLEERCIGDTHGCFDSKTLRFAYVCARVGAVHFRHVHCLCQGCTVEDWGNLSCKFSLVLWMLFIRVQARLYYTNKILYCDCLVCTLFSVSCLFFICNKPQCSVQLRLV